jgi:hypothetical protein
LPGAMVRAFDKNNTVLFEVLTDANGDIATQDLIEYTRTAQARLSILPSPWRRRRPVMHQTPANCRSP